MDKKKYPGRAQQALGKLLWKVFLKLKVRNNSDVYEACKSICHECTLKDAVEIYKEHI